jgi:competence protein ComEA
MLLLSALLILSLVARLCIPWLPGREPSGWQSFLHESEVIMHSLNASTGPQVYGSDSTASIHPDRQISRKFQSRPQPVDINRSDSAALLPLPGIGPVLAGRIIRYRELLGGFNHAGQLNEVYGLPEETVSVIRESLRFDTAAIRQIRVNACTFSELLRHPYLEFEDVKAILRYRDDMGSITSLEEILANGLLADSTLEKISPYLDLSL